MWCDCECLSFSTITKIIKAANEITYNEISLSICTAVFVLVFTKTKDLRHELAGVKVKSFDLIFNRYNEFESHANALVEKVPPEPHR